MNGSDRELPDWLAEVDGDERAWRAAAAERFGAWPPPKLRTEVQVAVTCRRCGHRIERAVYLDDEVEFVCPTHGPLDLPARLANFDIENLMTERKATRWRTTIKEAFQRIRAYPRHNN